VTRPPHIVLPTGLSDPAVGKALHERGPLLLEIPEALCYHIHRAAPPGGWRRATRELLRPGLFPESLDALHWDETIHADGSWEIWGLPEARLREMLGPHDKSVRVAGRKIRILPTGTMGGQGLAGFPNLAPSNQRPLRLPWQRLRRWVRWGLPALTLAGSALFTLFFLISRWPNLDATHPPILHAAQLLESSLSRERGTVDALRPPHTPPGKRGEATPRRRPPARGPSAATLGQAQHSLELRGGIGVGRARLAKGRGHLGHHPLLHRADIGDGGGGVAFQ